MKEENMFYDEESEFQKTNSLLESRFNTIQHDNWRRRLKQHIHLAKNAKLKKFAIIMRGQ